MVSLASQAGLARVNVTRGEAEAVVALIDEAVDREARRSEHGAPDALDCVAERPDRLATLRRVRDRMQKAIELIEGKTKK